MSTKVILDTQIFNNQVQGWESGEVRVVLKDDNARMPMASEFFFVGGGVLLDLEINSFTDFYYKGLCNDDVDKTQYAFADSTGPREDSCRYRRYNIDHSITTYGTNGQNRMFTQKLKETREKQKMEIDKLIETSKFPIYTPQLSKKIELLFEDYFNGLVLLGRILQSSFLLNKLKPFPISKECNESGLIHDTRQMAEYFITQIHVFEGNTTDHNKTIGFADSVKSHSHLLVTTFIRYYANETNVDALGSFFNSLNILMTEFRNKLTPNGVCFELIPYVQKFLTNSTIVQRIVFDSRKSIMHQRLSDLIERRDARLIYSEYTSQNFMSIRVRYRHLYGEIISRADEYNMFRLIADIGSAMGLYFGFSILTIYEFCVFVFVKNAAEGVVPAPHRAQLYDDSSKKQKNNDELTVDRESNVPPPPL